MRKSTAVAGIASVVVAALIAFAWYWSSPFYAVAGLRDAAVAADAKELAERIDFPRLREEIRAQVSQVFIGNMADSLRDNPFAALGLALATKLADVMIDAMVTPTGIATLVDPAKDRKPDSVSGLHLMLSADFTVKREGIHSFNLSSIRDRESTPTLRFNREGLTWRLVGLQLPKEFLAKKMGDATTARSPAVAYIPKWEFHQKKDPMDDIVTIVLSRGADEEVSTHLSSVRPALILRCRANEFEAYINVHSSVDYDYGTRSASIRLRFDDNQPMRETWSVSDDRKALFASQPRLFVANLLKAKSMQFEWKGFGGSSSVARFTKGDLEAHAARFDNRCGGRELLEQTPQEPVAAPAKEPLQSPGVASTPQPNVPPPAPATANLQQYIIPAGAYVDPSGVMEMLANAKVPYYTELIQTRQGSVTRLRVGPFPNREAAETMLEQLKKLGLRPGNITEKS